MTVLVTGFGPFGDVADNASGRVAERLVGRRVAGHRVVAEVLPTAYGEARARVAALVAGEVPRAAVAIGVSRDDVARVEARAFGVVTSEHPDVAGEVWAGRALGGGGDLHNAAVERWLAAARTVDARIRRSEDCGGYVCNAVHHALLEAMGPGACAAFLHIPRATDDASIDHIERVVIAVLEAMVDEDAGT